MSDQLYRLDSDWMKRTAWAADILAGLHDIGVLVPVEIDYEALVAYLHATLWSLRRDWNNDEPLPSKDDVLHFAKRIMTVGIEPSETVAP